MRFGWDPRKSERNARERALAFDVAMALFDGPTLELDDLRRDYGETRITSPTAAWLVGSWSASIPGAGRR